MCTPLAIASATAAVGTVQSVMNFIGTQQAHHAAVQAANLNFAAKDEQVQRENAQLSGQQSEQNLTDAVATAQSFGRIATTASALGLGQYSSHQLISANAAAGNRAMGITDRNYAEKRTSLQTELEGASLQRSSAIASAPRANLLTLGMDLANTAVNSAGNYAAFGGKFGIKPASGSIPQAGRNMDGSMFFG